MIDTPDPALSPINTPAFFDWVHDLKEELKALDEIPLTGAAPPFPWKDLSDRLARAFEREGLTIQPGELKWRAAENLYEGMGDHPFPLIFSIPSLRGQVCWIMPEQEMGILESLLLTKDTHPLSFQDSALTESFYRFFALEVLYHLSQIKFDQSLSPLLTNQETLPNQDALCWDIALLVKQQMVWGRLIISPELRRSWVEHFAQQEPSLLTQKIAQTIELIMHVEAGKTHLNLEEWKQVQLGDFILLDNCSLDSNQWEEGRVLLTVNGRVAFRAKLKNGSLKILELPLYHEVHSPMAKESDEDEDEDDLSDLDLTDDDDEDDLDELEEDEEASEENSLFEEEEKEASPEAKDSPAKVASAPAKAVAPPKEGPLTPDQIPLALVVEVGRIQITVEKMLKLEPGNLLELELHPENGVDLTINGKVVGRGELIRLGSTIGVRILQLGH